MRRLTSRLVPGLALLCACVLVTVAFAKLSSTSHFTLQELDGAPELNPKQFANLFENFKYSFSPWVMDVDEFLADQAGDCDDYAILADHVLARKGYHTRIVRVAMVDSDVGHAICYVAENKGYLDYNNRKYSLNIERCGPTLRQIAAQVADSFGKNWTSATEYTFTY
ncbi:MAG TPA: transglutaminase-like cysteine peptidase, partial [Candidatus Didemnitutus sp.]|nr:transglutaminase-like cysteine peptidase [Candidatus Didemnitutus sp.]